MLGTTFYRSKYFSKKKIASVLISIEDTEVSKKVAVRDVLKYKSPVSIQLGLFQTRTALIYTKWTCHAKKHLRLSIMKLLSTMTVVKSVSSKTSPTIIRIRLIQSIF